MTFVTPHQNPTSGGVYVIEQLAAHLAHDFEVRLIVQKGERRPIPGVKISKIARLDPEKIPDADAILLPADSRDGEAFAALPPSKGERFLLLQGFGTIGNPAVVENLGRGFRVIGTATWLVEEARARGADANLARFGIDRKIFHAAGEESRHASLVSMMTHHLDWKGTADGLRALDLVRRAIPDCELLLFGVEEPDLEGARFVPRPAREAVASIFRQSTVFVCPSWEEGFGLPGLEAIACGAALATTDTKGSRDYATDGRTALVTPPRDPEALAGSVIRLLRDLRLRSRLAASGERLVGERFGSWGEAARRFGMVLSGRSVPVAVDESGLGDSG